MPALRKSLVLIFKISTIAVLYCLLFSLLLHAQQKESTGTFLFDDDWRFIKDNPSNAESPEFDDSKWRKLDLPHDWSIEDLPGTNSPFNPGAVNGVSVGFTLGGTAWYRKEFIIPAGQKDKRIYIQFDGVYMNTDIWLNGKHLGVHPYGYTSFWFDVTGHIKFDQKNVLAVQVKNEGANSRWYSGSGIYHHVWLKILEPVHVAQWGTYITTPEVNVSSAKAGIKTSVINESAEAASVTLHTRILNAKGEEVANTKSEKNLAANTTFEFDQEATIASPSLWSPESPALYTTITEVYADKKLTDRAETKFGIRSISFDPENGFLLNGKSVKLKGACFHHDNGPLGSKSYDKAEERKVELLKASGFNAIRCSHNPPAPAFLDACDRLGMLVIDEAYDMWREGKNEQDYHLYFNEWWQKDMESMILRDRNHPSIIMWSIGNELVDMDKPEVAQDAKMLADFVHKMEPTRPVTAAVNGVSEKKDPFFTALDICGYNYSRDKYESDHQRKPGRVMFATESYPLEAYEYWMGVTDHPWVIGDFVWTGFDYIGEASIGWLGYMQEKSFYPWNLAFCGDIDICGWKRPQSYYRDVLWKNGENVSIFVKPPKPSFKENPKKELWSIWNWQDVVADWNWKGYENKPLDVEVYSSCEEAELFLNGRSLGKKETNRSTKFMAEWQVPYQKGVLKAIGYIGSKKVAESELHTAGEPVQMKLTADRTKLRANGRDLSYITVELIDANGNRNTKAENLIRFEIEGPGTIAGVGNANPVSTESFQQPQRKAWQGKCLVIVKSEKAAGNITLKASAEGITQGKIIISSNE